MAGDLRTRKRVGDLTGRGVAIYTASTYCIQSLLIHFIGTMFIPSTCSSLEERLLRLVQTTICNGAPSCPRGVQKFEFSTVETAVIRFEFSAVETFSTFKGFAKGAKGHLANRSKIYSHPVRVYAYL